MANLSNINNKFIVTDGGNALINATANLTTYGGITIDNFSDPSIAMKTTGTSGWLWTQYITSTGTNNFSMGVNQTTPYWCVKAGAGLDVPDLVVNSSGRVGIGTTDPSFQLSIENHDTTTSTASMELDGKRTNGTDGAVGELIFSNNGDTFATVAGFRDGSDNKGSLQFQTQDGSFTTKMTISSEGNVGIGTISPDIGSNAGTAILTLKNTGTNRAVLNMTSTTPGTGVYAQEAFYNGGVLKTLVQHVGDGTVDSGYIKWFTTASSGSTTERMRIHSGGSVTMGEFNSTNAPNNGILKIKTGGSTAGTCYPLLSIMGSTHLATRQYGIGFDPEGYSNRLKMFFGVDGDGNGYSYGDFVWNINTQVGNDIVSPSDEKMRLNKLGYLGLGGDAAVKLEVFNGSLRVRGSSSNLIELSNTSGNTRAALGNAGNEGDLSLYRSNNSKYVYLSSYYNCYIDPQQAEAAVGIGGAGTGLVNSGPGGNTTLDVQGPLRNKRVMRGWYHGGPITSTNAYRHIKTNLWMGGSPGNTEYIMGGFEAKGFAYYGSYPGFGHGTCMFHNWSGGFASLQVSNFGTAGFMQSPYTSSDGYCVIVLRHNTYMQPVIDFSQYYTPYPWRTSYVTAETTSNNTTGVY